MSNLPFLSAYKDDLPRVCDVIKNGAVLQKVCASNRSNLFPDPLLISLLAHYTHSQSGMPALSPQAHAARTFLSESERVIGCRSAQEAEGLQHVSQSCPAINSQGGPNFGPRMCALSSSLTQSVMTCSSSALKTIQHHNTSSLCC